MATQIKLYVFPENEIRIFTIAANEGFAALQQRVKALIGREDFRLFWTDSEGDRVICGSDDELKQAREFNGSKLKLVVGPAKSSGEGKRVHRFVQCDGCNGQIAGTRFKCLECPDFDLCETCEGRGKHNQHEMLAIRDPANKDWVKFFRRRMHGGCGPAFRRPGQCQGNQCPSQGPRGPFIPPFLRPFMDRTVELDIDGDKPFPEVLADIAKKIFEELGKATEGEEEQQKAGENVNDKEQQNKTGSEEKTSEISSEKIIENSEATTQRAPSPVPSEADAGWTTLQAESVEEKKPEQDKSAQKPDESKIGSALRTMEEMGFPKESELIRRLLQNYNGDVSRVLDILK